MRSSTRSIGALDRSYSKLRSWKSSTWGATPGATPLVFAARWFSVRTSRMAWCKLQLLGNWAIVVAAVQTARLSRQIQVSEPSVEGQIGPVTLNLPHAIVAEGQQGPAEAPRAFISVLTTGRIVPGVRSGSVRASDNSCPVTLAIAASPCEM